MHIPTYQVIVPKEHIDATIDRRMNELRELKAHVKQVNAALSRWRFIAYVGMGYMAQDFIDWLF